MRLARIAGSVMLLVVMTSLLLAADVNGKWSGKSEEGPEWVFNFNADGAKLTGTMVGADGKERPINEGKLEGDNLSFSVNSEWQGTAIKLVMKGKVAGEKINLRVDTDDGAWGTDLVLARASK
jgi:hypothetical protein